MQFLEAIQTCVLKKYADFNGRASRSEFWWYSLGYVVLSYAWSFIISMITGASVMAAALVLYSILGSAVADAGCWCPSSARYRQEWLVAVAEPDLLRRSGADLFLGSGRS